MRLLFPLLVFTLAGPTAWGGLPAPGATERVEASPRGAPDAAPTLADPSTGALATARALLRSGDVETARVALAAVAGRADAPARDRRDAWHLLGRLELEAGRSLPALDAFERALDLGLSRSAPSAITDVIRWGLARAAAGAKRYERAERALRRVARAPSSDLRAEAVRLRARLLTEQGELRAAKRVYDDYLERWPQAPEAREVRVRRAALLIAVKRPHEARGALRELVDEAPSSRAGLEARVLLVSLGEPPPSLSAPPTSLDALEALVDERRFGEARPPLEALLDVAREARRARTLRRGTELLLKIQYATGDLRGALSSHEWLEAHDGEGLSDHRLARLFASLGEHKRAERVYLDRFKRHKGRAYWRAVGDLRFEFGRYREAYRAYYLARKRRRGGDVRLSEPMIWCLLRMGEPAKAAALWRDAGQRRGQRSLRLRYWYARASQLAGDEAEARRVFAQLIDDAPYDYYGVQASSRLAELDSEAPADPGRGTVIWTDADRRGAWGDAPKRQPTPELVTLLEGFGETWGGLSTEAKRAAELARVGLIDDALTELRVIDMDLRAVRRGGASALARRARSDLLDNRREPRARGGASMRERRRFTRKAARAFVKDRLALRADLREIQRAFGDAYGLRRDAYESGAMGEAEGPSAPAWRDAYPIAWPELVKTFTTQFDVPPYFLYGLMTVESAFHPHAVSVSNAYGLLQVIPRTGRRAASELGYPEFSPELLLQPEVGIYFGSYYLSSLLTKFQGQEALAAAAYNAGPHRVSAWLDARGDSPLDMFIEEIPYAQTRGYTKTALKNIARYRATYHEGERTYVTNRILRAYLPQPNY